GHFPRFDSFHQIIRQRVKDDDPIDKSAVNQLEGLHVLPSLFLKIRPRSRSPGAGWCDALRLLHPRPARSSHVLRYNPGNTSLSRSFRLRYGTAPDALRPERTLRSWESSWSRGTIQSPSLQNSACSSRPASTC